MEVCVLPPVHVGLDRYRITMPGRPGHYTILEVPADAEDPIGLVELFASSHLSVLDWVVIEDALVDDDELPPRPPADCSEGGTGQARQEITTG